MHLDYLSDQILVFKNLSMIREYLIKNFGNNKTKTIKIAIPIRNPTNTKPNTGEANINSDIAIEIIPTPILKNLLNFFSDFSPIPLSLYQQYHQTALLQIFRTFYTS